MSSISANTLFHFTKNKDTLISILKSNFRPSYCCEKYYLGKGGTWQVPMVCFCDIPLSQVQEHTSWYGEYAIGMTKEWAIKNDINPILYINQEIKLIDTIKENLNYLIEERDINRENKKHIQSIIDNLLYQYAFIKPYEGEQYQQKADRRIHKRFYDEREWRYIPVCEDKSLFCFATAFFYGQHERLNESIRSYSINFEPKYINYIIVSKETEILEIKRQIENIKGNFPHNDVELLTTRIISMERIKEDF